MVHNITNSNIRLSERLLQTVNLVTPGYRVADVGCDHAHSSIYLIQYGLANQVLAVDVNSGPLTIAKKNIARYGLEESIHVRRSDGLKEITPGEVDVLLIGGLGGRLMIRILKEGEGVVKQTKELVLQPQSEIPMVRRYLHEKGYRIIKDSMLKDEGKFYVAIKAVPSERERYNKDIYYIYGKIPLIEKNDTLKEFLNREYKAYHQIRMDLEKEKNDSQRALKRLGEVKEHLDRIEEARTYFTYESLVR